MIARTGKKSMANLPPPAAPRQTVNTRPTAGRLPAPARNTPGSGADIGVPLRNAARYMAKKRSGCPDASLTLSGELGKRTGNSVSNHVRFHLAAVLFFTFAVNARRSRATPSLPLLVTEKFVRGLRRIPERKLQKLSSRMACIPATIAHEPCRRHCIGHSSFCRSGEPFARSAACSHAWRKACRDFHRGVERKQRYSKATSGPCGKATAQKTRKPDMFIFACSGSRKKLVDDHNFIRVLGHRRNLRSLVRVRCRQRGRVRDIGIQDGACPAGVGVGLVVL